MDKITKYQKNIYDLLVNSIKKDRLVHAYLFIGDKCNSKVNLVKEIMKKFYNENDYSHIDNFSHLNLISIKPEGNTIKKEQIISLKEELSKKPSIEGPRFYIIDEVDKLNISSKNSLLKFLEEPPFNTYGFLITDNLSDVIPTIISRCQVIKFNKEEKDYGDNALNVIFNNLIFDDNKIKELIENKKIQLLIDFFNNFIDNINSDNIILFYYSNLDILLDSELLILFSKIFELYLLDILKYNKKADIILNIFKDKIENNILKEDKIKDIINYLIKIEHYIYSNVNKELIVDELLSKLTR